MNQFDQMFYHIYPLGLAGALEHNDGVSAPVQRLDALHPWIDHMSELGLNTLYLGPVFESMTHGYDTTDYYHVDRRLGDRATLARFVARCHERGVRVLLDGVFNHVGRDFWAFRDLLANGEHSPYRDWFANVRFGQGSPFGDPFSYEAWNGHFALVKLNLQHPEVKAHLFGAVEQWVRDYGIDGLRLDAADVMDIGFLSELAAFCRGLHGDFWLLGEVIHGDYRRWANPATLDSVTNYEAYKGLFSSHNDKNFHEIAYTLNRQFGPNGMYRDMPLYSFADNHDVNRLASTLRNPAHMYSLYALLFSMPGLPSIYYGSEWGIGGSKTHGSDAPLRPRLDLDAIVQQSQHGDLAHAIARFARLRQETPALRYGNYQQLLVAPEQLVFARATEHECVIVAINAAAEPASLHVEVPRGGTKLVDLLNPGSEFTIQNGRAQIEAIPPTWARILAVR